jgi:ribosomal protein S18 acetylase RimI-like enzyme
MTQPVQSHIEAYALQHYDVDIDAGIGQLMPYLDPTFSAEPRPADLRAIIASTDHDQLVALRLADSRIVGAATMTIVRGYGLGRAGRLEDFVVDPTIRRQGVATKLWTTMMQWCEAKDLDSMVFETERDRPEALAFYEKMGARIVKDSLQQAALHLAVAVPK